MVLGSRVGRALGLWSFDGPLTVPAWLGEYDSTPRRLVRLGHIAWLGLGILNVLVGRELAGIALSPGQRRLASVTMNIGNVLLPLTLFAAAVVPPIKYGMGLPATCVFIALALVAYGTWNQRHVAA